MKYPTITSLFICVFLMMVKTNAQVQIENLSFEKALKKAKAEDKILMVIINSKTCDQCNDVAKKGLGDERTFAINKLAVTIKLTLDNPDWENLGKQYYKGAATQFGTLFFNNKGILVHRFDRSTSSGIVYLTEVGTALQNVNAPNEEAILEELVKREKHANLATINSLLAKKKILSASTDSLLKTFINTTSIDSFNTFNYFETLARFAPMLNTKADSIMRLSKNFRDNLGMLDAKERNTINNEIYHKTWLNAVATKDYSLASRLADYPLATDASLNYSENKSNARAYRLSLFYKAINDTAEYLKFGAAYIEGNLMRWIPDALKKFYMEKSETSLSNQAKGIPTQIVNYNASLQRVSSSLNTYAWNFYKMSNDTTDWKKAVKWSKRGLEYYVSPELMDTYAQLLYVTGNREEAILQEQNVIEEKKKAHREKDIPITERILARMKSGAAKVAEQ